MSDTPIDTLEGRGERIDHDAARITGVEAKDHEPHGTGRAFRRGKKEKRHVLKPSRA